MKKLRRAEFFIVYVGGSTLTFDPQQITIAPGDTIAFINQGGGHNVVADDNSFRCAQGCDGQPNGSGAISNANWLARVTFPKAGRFGYFCEAHGQPGKGMFGTVVVQGAQQAPPPVDTSPAPALQTSAAIALIAGLTLLARRYVPRKFR